MSLRLRLSGHDAQTDAISSATTRSLKGSKKLSQIIAEDASATTEGLKQERGDNSLEVCASIKNAEATSEAC